VHGHLTDEEIEARLRAAPAEAWAELWAAVDALAGEEQHLRWGGGEPVGTTVVDGEERPVIQMPYAIYGEATERVLRAIGRAGLIVPFDWPDWEGVRTYRGSSALDDAPVADAVRMVTAIVRAERFSDGTIGATIDDGTLLAALRRLRRWRDQA
jgi:Family of unknown function (DUF6508)